MSFPDKALREKCWASRDSLWKCLDENNDNQDICAKFRATYTSSCPAQWVKHFDRKREYLKFKDQIQNEGAQQQHNEKRSSLLTVPSNGGIYANSEEEHSTSTGTIERNSSSNTSPNSPNTRIFRKFQPSTFR